MPLAFCTRLCAVIAGKVPSMPLHDWRLYIIIVAVRWTRSELQLTLELFACGTCSI